MMQSILKTMKEPLEFDLAPLQYPTEGFLAQDLALLLEKSRHYKQIRGFGSLQLQDVEKALSDYVPMSLKGVKITHSNVQWDDVGGMNPVKKILRETLEWPTKYNAIFQHCPLRLRSG
jgi:peroxin-1